MVCGVNAANLAAGGPVVEFRLADPHASLRGVRLAQEVRLPGDGLDFTYADGVWTLSVPRPDVDRMEYLFEVTHPDGGTEWVADPATPRSAPGAFGAKSVLEFDSYLAPAWLTGPAPEGRSTAIKVDSQILGTAVTGQLWSPAELGEDEPAPLVVVHDGPEFAELARITSYAAAMVEAGEWPELRMALLAPDDRDRWYAADPAYARALVTEVLPALGPATYTVGAGASLGGLAMLHAQRRYPDALDGLFLMSGSFFHPDHDAHEARFARYGPISRFVVELIGSVAGARTVPTVLAVGRTEENAANNDLMAATLRRLGYDVDLSKFGDVHNYTAWRDVLHPHLTELVRGLHTT